MSIASLARPNERDIERYVQNVLCDSKSFKRLASREQKLSHELTAKALERAEGIFIWVILVTRSLSNGMRNRDTISDLQHRLRSLPRDLELLYERLVVLIEPEYLTWTSKTFQILKETEQLSLDGFPIDQNPHYGTGDPEHCSLTLMGLYMAHNDRIDVKAAEKWTDSDVAQRCEELQIQLMSRRAGFLELRESGPPRAGFKVHWLHRTAEEFLKQTEVWEGMLKQTADHFNPHLAPFRSFTPRLTAMTNVFEETKSQMQEGMDVFQANGHLERLESKKEILSPYEVARQALFLAHSLEMDGLLKPVSILDDLDYIMTTKLTARLADVKNSNSKIHWTNRWLRARMVQPATSLYPIVAILGLGTYYISNK